MVLLFDIYNQTRALLLKEARIEVITENNKTPTANAVNCNTTHPDGKLLNSVYREENASFRGEESPYSQPEVEKLRAKYREAVPLLQFTVETTKSSENTLLKKGNTDSYGQKPIRNEG